MGDILEIYGTKVILPDQPAGAEIDYWDKPKKDQYWRRKPLPEIFDHVATDDAGKPVLSVKQQEYVNKEIDRIKDGYWFFNNGEATYITGRHYFYLQYWILEDQKPPKYRDVSRRYFLFLDHWERSSWCLGIIRGKGRRSGATSESSSNLIYSSTQKSNANCGIVSKTNADARKVFIFRAAFGFRHLPFFLQPAIENAKDAKTELRFAEPEEKGKKNKQFEIKGEVKGLNSKLDFQPTALNSYDSERMTWVLADEGGKWPPEVPFSQFLSILTETLVQGSIKVGFVEAPSTVNEMTKRGGAEYKSVWDDANQFKKWDEEDDENEETPNRFVRYFVPAFDGLEGYIDRHGMSIIDDPTKEQSDYIYETTGKRIKTGAKAYLEKKRSKLAGLKLEEEIRKYPFNEDEMFMSANTDCVFNSFKINEQIKRLTESKVFLRQVTFFRELDGKVAWRDDPNGYWKILSFPPKGQENKSHFEGKLQKPSRAIDGGIGVDGYSQSQGGRKYGSKAAAYIYRKFDISDPENTGLFIGEFYGRPQIKDTMHEQILFAAEFYGYPVWYEHTADDYESWFRHRGKIGFLGKYPMSAIALDKRINPDRHYGFPISPFSMTKQLDTAIGYVDKHCEKIYFIELLKNYLIFEPDKRTDYDQVVASMIALVCGLELTNIKRNLLDKPLIRVYNNVYTPSAN